MSSRVLVIVLSMILSTPTFAQTLKGKIADELTKEYLERAEVYIPEIHKKAITDNFGSFEFRDLPKGKFKVQVEWMVIKHTSHLLRSYKELIC